MSIPKEYAIPFGILAPLGTAGNGLLITVILLNKKLRTTSNIHLVAIAIGGLLHSVVGLPYFTVLLSNKLPAGWCRFAFGFVNLGYTSTILFTTSLAIDRWMYMFRPLRYETLVNGKRSAIVCSLIGIYTICLLVSGTSASFDASEKLFSRLHELYNITLAYDYSALGCIAPSLSSREFVILLFYGHYLPCIFASTILYGSILCLARKQARTITTAMAGSHNHQRWWRQQRGIILMLTSVVFFALAWLPYLVQIAIDSNGLRISSLFSDPSNKNKMWIYLLHISKQLSILG